MIEVMSNIKNPSITRNKKKRGKEVFLNFHRTSPHRDHSNKKEREDQRESDGTSGDESSSDVGEFAVDLTSILNLAIKCCYCRRWRKGIHICHVVLWVIGSFLVHKLHWF